MANINFKKNTETPAASSPKLSFSFFARSFNWFIGLVCLLILVAGLWFLIRPKYLIVIGNEAVLAQEHEYESKITYLKELNEVKNLYRSVSPGDKEKIDTVLSARQDADSVSIALLREIGYVARLNGGVIENMKTTILDAPDGKFIAIAGPAKSIATTKAQIVTVSFTLTKIEYPSLKRFIARLEHSLRLLDITKFDYDPTAKQAQIELFAYHLKS